MEAVNKLFDISKTLHVDAQEVKLRDAAYFLVNSAKTVMNSPSEDEVSFLEEFQFH